jgi:hypothetical protein
MKLTMLRNLHCVNFENLRLMVRSRRRRVVSVVAPLASTLHCRSLWIQWVL